MIVEQILGNVAELPAGHLDGVHLEKVALPLQDLRRRTLRVTTDHGRELGIRLPVSSPNLRDGDILLNEGDNLVVVTSEPTDILVIAPENTYQMGVVAHGLGNRHLPAQFFPAGEVFEELGEPAHNGVMVIQYDHTAEHFLTHNNVRYARSNRVMAVPFRHAEHTH